MKEVREKILGNLGLVESYYHLDEEGNMYYAFLAPGKKHSDFKISYTGNRLKIEADKTIWSGIMSYYGYKFDLSKAKSEYKDGLLIVKVPSKSNIFGKIKVEGS